MKHAIYRTYLALLRGEHFDFDEYTDERMERDVYEGLETIKHHWQADRLVTRAIWKEHRIGWGKQFELGICGTPTRLENKLFAVEMVKMFGDNLTVAEDFELNGLLKYESWHWIMKPLKKNGKIDRFEFGSYKDMQGWTL